MKKPRRLITTSISEDSDMNDLKVTSTLDTSGKCCPMPMVETNKAIKSLASGDILEIIATDPGTVNDIPSWCNRTGNRLLDTREDDKVYRYYVSKN
jgi:tRNA 2-thiouridine synthesizing protein A